MKEALEREGARVIIHDDLFPHDAPDQLWLQAVGKRGWIVLTKDQKIRARKAEREILLRNGVRMFVLTAGNLTGADMATIFVKALPRMDMFIADNPGPFIARVTRGGSVEPVL